MCRFMCVGLVATVLVAVSPSLMWRSNSPNTSALSVALGASLVLPACYENFLASGFDGSGVLSPRTLLKQSAVFFSSFVVSDRAYHFLDGFAFFVSWRSVSVCALVVIALSWGCSFCVVDALTLMVSSSLLFELFKCCLVGRRVGVVRVEGVLLKCLVEVDRVFAPVDSTVSDFSLFDWLLNYSYLLSLVVDRQLDPGSHRSVIAVQVDLSHCFCVYAMFDHGCP